MLMINCPSHWKSGHLIINPGQSSDTLQLAELHPNLYGRKLDVDLLNWKDSIDAICFWERNEASLNWKNEKKNRNWSTQLSLSVNQRRWRRVGLWTGGNRRVHRGITPCSACCRHLFLGSLADWKLCGRNLFFISDTGTSGWAWQTHRGRRHTETQRVWMLKQPDNTQLIII